MHKPWHSLIFVMLVFLVLGGIGLLFPENGISLGKELVLNFPAPGSLFEESDEQADITTVLEAVNRIDTTFRIDEPGESVDTAAQLQIPPSEPASVQLNMNIQHDNPAALKKFFDALIALKDDPSLIRVLHYGDSQIEADRITDYLRLKLQSQFGGSGPGLTSLLPLTASAAARIYNSPGWERYTAFTAPDKRVQHNSYGVRASFARFMPYNEFGDTVVVHNASVQVVAKSRPANDYSKIKLFYGGASARTWCEFYDGPALLSADSLEAGGVFHVREYEVSTNTQEFRFTGTDSPDFYALSLEGEKGVMVDNIAMRGSSGTFFHRVDRKQMKRFYEYLNVKLIILQFGDNTLPSLEDTTMARNYSRYMRNQIAIVKKLAPGASILFIGPSDMSIKEGTSYVTYSMLEPLRDYLKEVVLQSGCAYFDLYDVMGGRNSMPAWVEQKLAGKDYTHFSAKGARKIATMLYAALINDYNSYVRTVK